MTSSDSSTRSAGFSPLGWNEWRAKARTTRLATHKKLMIRQSVSDGIPRSRDRIPMIGIQITTPTIARTGVLRMFERSVAGCFRGKERITVKVDTTGMVGKFGSLLALHIQPFFRAFCLMSLQIAVRRSGRRESINSLTTAVAKRYHDLIIAAWCLQ
jgi:hypothetical protein